MIGRSEGPLRETVRGRDGVSTGSGCDPVATAPGTDSILKLRLYRRLPYAYGHVGREFKLRPFSAGSILTLRNRIEPLAFTTSVERTPRKMQSTKLTPSMT